jgi:hypothetical protein
MYLVHVGTLLANEPRNRPARSPVRAPVARLIQGSQIKRQVQKTGYLEALNIQIYLL